MNLSFFQLALLPSLIDPYLRSIAPQRLSQFQLSLLTHLHQELLGVRPFLVSKLSFILLKTLSYAKMPMKFFGMGVEFKRLFLQFIEKAGHSAKQLIDLDNIITISRDLTDQPRQNLLFQLLDRTKLYQKQAAAAVCKYLFIHKKSSLVSRVPASSGLKERILQIERDSEPPVAEVQIQNKYQIISQQTAEHAFSMFIEEYPQGPQIQNIRKSMRQLSKKTAQKASLFLLILACKYLKTGYQPTFSQQLQAIVSLGNPSATASSLFVSAVFLILQKSGSTAEPIKNIIVQFTKKRKDSSQRGLMSLTILLSIPLSKPCNPNLISVLVSQLIVNPGIVMKINSTKHLLFILSLIMSSADWTGIFDIEKSAIMDQLGIDNLYTNQKYKPSQLEKALLHLQKKLKEDSGLVIYCRALLANDLSRMIYAALVERSFALNQIIRRSKHLFIFLQKYFLMKGLNQAALIVGQFGLQSLPKLTVIEEPQLWFNINLFNHYSLQVSEEQGLKLMRSLRKREFRVQESVQEQEQLQRRVRVLQHCQNIFNMF